MNKPENATNTWFNGKYYNDPWSLQDIESIDIEIEEKDDGLFHIGQCYEKEVAKTLFCKKCGDNKFHVGRGNYYTAIKCVNCGWEICEHDG